MKEINLYSNEYRQRTKKNIPSIICGDFNSPRNSTDNVVDYMIEEGYTPTIGHKKFVSHKTHRGQYVSADYVWYNNNIEIIDSYLGMPRESGESIEQWNDNFKLSDHKPLYAVFECEDDLTEKF
eukprot:TRINITY_DN1201_c0_g1_i1.p2 TRINITY_DN1201_c0_g1~~TRINITY_DN1201_c0_g1_i1.p2  ORF type:complete len:124 (-),score=27.26 TRINITY_DN1201_c0_g1_i1:155-526(-)